MADPSADRVALRHLVETYAAGCDRRDLSLLLQVFVDGAEMHVHRPGKPSTMTAPADLERIPRGLARYDRTLHVLANHFVQLDGDEATGDLYCSAHHLTGTEDFVMHIRYEDRYRRTPDGWRIARRDLQLLWTTTETVTPS